MPDGQHSSAVMISKQNALHHKIGWPQNDTSERYSQRIHGESEKWAIKNLNDHPMPGSELKFSIISLNLMISFYYQYYYLLLEMKELKS